MCGCPLALVPILPEKFEAFFTLIFGFWVCHRETGCRREGKRCLCHGGIRFFLGGFGLKEWDGFRGSGARLGVRSPGMLDFWLGDNGRILAGMLNI